MLVIDAHEDIAWNMLTWGRDYTRSAQAIRQDEVGGPAPQHNGQCMLGLSEWLLGQVAVIFGTLFMAPEAHRLSELNTQVYADARQAHALAVAQLDVYYRLAEHEQIALIRDRADLEAVLASWAAEADPLKRQVGIVPLMEGADPIVEPEQAEEWFERGVRIVGLAWEATRYAGGTHEPGPLTPLGHELLEVMTDLGLILDLSHAAEEAYSQAIERFEGVVIASHSNPRLFCPTSRGLSDEMISMLAERGGVVGVVPYNAFLKPGWRRGDPKNEVSISDVADAIDHVCQLTGDAQHVGIGSDFDGGLGMEHTPAEIDTVADLLIIARALQARGYAPEDVEAVMGGNWLRILRRALPE
jgi:membrane dipeptidase